MVRMKTLPKKKVADYFLYDMIGKYMPALSTGAMTPEQFVEGLSTPGIKRLFIYMFTK